MSAIIPPSVASPSIVDRIHAYVRDEILAGRQTPGSALRQDEIAARLGVSKIPLREAFSRLESEGLVTLKPRRGYAVTSFDIDEIQEIFELRAIVEEHAGRLAAQHRTADDIERVIALQQQMVELDRAQPDYHERWCSLNHDFHGAIFQASGRRHVIKMALQLRDLVEPYIRLETAVSGDDEMADLEHRQIVSAFQAGDAQLTGNLCASHCYHTRDRLVGALRRSNRSAAA